MKRVKIGMREFKDCHQEHSISEQVARIYHRYLKGGAQIIYINHQISSHRKEIAFSALLIHKRLL